MRAGTARCACGRRAGQICKANTFSLIRPYGRVGSASQVKSFRAEKRNRKTIHTLQVCSFILTGNLNLLCSIHLYKREMPSLFQFIFFYFIMTPFGESTKYYDIIATIKHEASKIVQINANIVIVYKK